MHETTEGYCFFLCFEFLSRFGHSGNIAMYQGGDAQGMKREKLLYWSRCISYADMAGQEPQSDIPHELHKIVSDRPFLTPSTEPAYDALLGIGYSLRLGIDDALQLEVFPQRRVLRVHTPLLSLELKDVIHVERHQDKFRVTSESASVSAIVEITEQGAISFVAGFDSPDALHFSVPLALINTTSVEQPASATLPRQGQEEQQTEKAHRKTLIGTIAGEPTYGMTKKNQPITIFPLAVVDGEGQTTWISIVLFGAKTDYVKQKKLKSGDKVEVIGYEHHRTHQHRSDEAMEVMEIYGSAIRPLFT